MSFTKKLYSVLWTIAAVWLALLIRTHASARTDSDSVAQGSTAVTYLPEPGELVALSEDARPELRRAFSDLWPADSSLVILALGARCHASITNLDAYDEVYAAARSAGHAFRIVLSSDTGQLPSYARLLPDSATVIPDQGGRLSASLGIALVPSALLLDERQRLVDVYFPGKSWPPVQRIAFLPSKENPMD